MHQIKYAVRNWWENDGYCWIKVNNVLSFRVVFPYCIEIMVTWFGQKWESFCPRLVPPRPKIQDKVQGLSTEGHKGVFSGFLMGSVKELGMSQRAVGVGSWAMVQPQLRLSSPSGHLEARMAHWNWGSSPVGVSSGLYVCLLTCFGWNDPSQINSQRKVAAKGHLWMALSANGEVSDSASEGTWVVYFSISIKIINKNVQKNVYV